MKRFVKGAVIVTSPIPKDGVFVVLSFLNISTIHSCGGNYIALEKNGTIGPILLGIADDTEIESDEH